jgi:polyphosphate kinase
MTVQERRDGRELTGQAPVPPHRAPAQGPAPALVPATIPVAAPQASPDPAERDFFNRDLSWLEFNRRVLHEATDERNPLLERVRFLQIFSTNLDEFFMKRVGTLQRLAALSQAKPTHDDLMPADQLKQIRRVMIQLILQHAECYRQQVEPALRASGIELLAWDELTESERDEAERYFRSSVFPILTPLAVDPGHPFPFISNLSVSLGVILQHPDRDRTENLFARIKIPEMLPRWIQLNRGAPGATRFRFFSLYDLIRHNLDDLFLGMQLVSVNLFRVTRSAEPEPDDDEADAAEDLRASVQEELRLRRFAPVVRLEHDGDFNPEMRQFLMHELELTGDDLYEAPLGLRFHDFRPVYELPVPKLSYAPWTPCVPPALADVDADFFGIIRGSDLLVHHPYESFNASVERFVNAAADDPKVLALKMTLYRTDEHSPFIPALIRAAESRKQVVCLVELKARFDEERNIILTQALEKAGVHVVYGVLGLKTHSKTTLVVRQEPEGIRCYAHIGSGNYHTQTARLYTDFGLFTSDPDITGDLVELFHHLTGRSLKRDYRKLLIAPANMRARFVEMIDREIDHARAGRPARIVAKMNSLEDRAVIRKLYEASGAGVEIDLLVRGLCCLRPQVPGKSERIRVISIIGRFLEHSRLFYFRNGAADPVDGAFFIGSADWMNRNLSARVEVVVPIEGRPQRERTWEILQIMLRDVRQAWDLLPDGAYAQRLPDPPDAAGTHQTLMEVTRQHASTIT